MRRLGALCIIFLLALASCRTGPLKDIRLGKDFAVIIPEDIPVYYRPSQDSEKFYLDEAEAFVVEDFTCAEGLNTSMCYWDLTTARSNPDIVKIVFYKVKFESGKEGYINARYFAPELSFSMTSEERTAVRGTTPREYAVKVRKLRKDTRAEAEAELEEIEQIRRAAIEKAPWPEETKELVLNRKVDIGMTRDQVMLSITHPMHMPKIKETVTEKGTFEEWTFEDVVFYFENGKVIKWKRTVRDTGKHLKSTTRDR